MIDPPRKAETHQLSPVLCCLGLQATLRGRIEIRILCGAEIGRDCRYVILMPTRSSDTIRLKPDTTYRNVTDVSVVSAFRRTVTVSAFRRAALVGACLALSLPVLAQQADRVRTEALARRATERLQSLQREADRLASEERTLLGDLRKLELERQITAEELRQVDTEHLQVAKQLSATNGRMRQLQEQDLAARPDVS